MQLVAYGAQDIYLTGNPQITFFKVVYRRHTNFAVESIEQTFNGTADFAKRVTATISRNGDLIQQMYLEVVLPNVTGATGGAPSWTYGVGNALVKQAEIEIGGQLIDRQYGDWMNIWTELTVPAGKRAGYDDMVGNSLLAGTQQRTQILTTAANPETFKRLYVPFQFWFNRNPGLALPLIALQYHEVKLNLELRPITDLVQNFTGGAPVASQSLSCKLYVDYVYLDTDERRRFAQVSHEYLIEQVQFTGTESIAAPTSGVNVTLNFNHPVKELIWAHTTTANAKAFATAGGGSGGAWFNYSGASSSGMDSFTSALLQLNGHDRFSVRFADYFRKVQNYEHHTRAPRVGAELNATNVSTSTSTMASVGQAAGGGFTNLVYANGAAGVSNGTLALANLGSVTGIAGLTCATTTTTTTSESSFRQYIYSYSFALSPEEHQPSGTCNFSRIDNAVLQMNYGADSGTRVVALAEAMNLNIYAVNYNVLRIMSGMGGLAYSN